jgi:hypothetical protein
LWLVAPQLQGAATGGIGDSFVLLPRTQDFVVLGVFCARFPPREATYMYILERGDFPTPHTKRALPRITLKF